MSFYRRFLVLLSIIALPVWANPPTEVYFEKASDFSAIVDSDNSCSIERLTKKTEKNAQRPSFLNDEASGIVVKQDQSSLVAWMEPVTVAGFASVRVYACSCWEKQKWSCPKTYSDALNAYSMLDADQNGYIPYKYIHADVLEKEALVTWIDRRMNRGEGLEKWKDQSMSELSEKRILRAHLQSDGKWELPDSSVEDDKNPNIFHESDSILLPPVTAISSDRDELVAWAGTSSKFGAENGYIYIMKCTEDGCKPSQLYVPKELPVSDYGRVRIVEANGHKKLALSVR